MTIDEIFDRYVASLPIKQMNVKGVKINVYFTPKEFDMLNGFKEFVKKEFNTIDKS